MKKQILSKAISVAVLALTVALVFTGAARAAAGTQNIQTQNVTASFVNEATGVITNVSVNLFHNINTFHVAPNREVTSEFSQISIFILQTDDFGNWLSTASCYSFQEGQQFQVSPELDSATLDVSSLPCTIFEGQWVFPSVDVNLTWTALPDPTTTNRTKMISQTPGSVVTGQFTFTTQPAQASGTITIDDGLTNFIPNPSASASIQSEKDHTVSH